MDAASIAHRMYEPFLKILRRRRVRLFYKFFPIDENKRVLDLGGGATFWDLALSLGFPLPKVTVLSILPPGNQARGYLNWVLGDARHAEYKDSSFDVVFCNSLVEHLSGWDGQVRLAKEVRRLAPSYFVQTPDKRFPIEPHLLTPFIHWLPKPMQRRMMRNFTARGIVTRPFRSYCERLFKELALISAREVRILLPDATLVIENFLTLLKSIIAVRTREAA